MVACYAQQMEDESWKYGYPAVSISTFELSHFFDSHRCRPCFHPPPSVLRVDEFPAMAMLVLPRRGDFSTRPVFSLLCKAFDCPKKKQACLKKPSAFGDFLKIRSPQRSSIIKLEKMGKEPFWRKLPFLRMTKYGRKSWCRNSCDTIDIAYVLDICHRSPFILVLSLGPPKSSYLTHPSILLASTCFALL